MLKNTQRETAAKLGKIKIKITSVAVVVPSVPRLPSFCFCFVFFELECVCAGVSLSLSLSVSVDVLFSFYCCTDVERRRRVWVGKKTGGGGGGTAGDVIGGECGASPIIGRR